MMRLTVGLPDDIGELVRSAAAVKGISPGDAVCDLIRRGLAVERMQLAEGLPCFVVGPDALPITLEQTLAIEDGL
jgi:hypothetical protein